MKELLSNLFGQYEPVLSQSVTSEGAIVSSVAVGAAGVDWEYIAGIVLFIVMLLGFFSILRAVFRR